jgi:hypothetical protein
MSEEVDIELYLTIDGQVFLAPQYNIAFEPAYGVGGACPDFVALDWRCKNVVIVEVTSAATLGGLKKKVKQRETRWYTPLRATLTKLKVINKGWQFRFLGFVRDENLARLEQEFTGDRDVTFFPIEKASFPWLYWDERIKNGLPGALS